MADQQCDVVLSVIDQRRRRNENSKKKKQIKGGGGREREKRGWWDGMGWDGGWVWIGFESDFESDFNCSLMKMS